MGLVIRPDDEIEKVEPWDGHMYSLEQIKYHIGGGYIEIVPCGPDYWMILDEDGIMKELEPNPIASALYQAGGGRSMILGTVLILARGEVE